MGQSRWWCGYLGLIGKLQQLCDSLHIQYAGERLLSAVSVEQQGAWQFAAPAWVEGVGHGLGSLVGIRVVLPVQAMAGQQCGMLGKPWLAGHGDQP